MVRVLDSWVLLPTFHVTTLCVSVTKNIIWYRPNGSDVVWLEGNRRSGVALAMRHRLSGISTYRLNEDEHSTYGPVWTVAPLPCLT